MYVYSQLNVDKTFHQAVIHTKLHLETIKNSTCNVLIVNALGLRKNPPKNILYTFLLISSVEIVTYFP